MLSNLHISGFVIIDDLEITLGRGLNVFTGETGAGKSLILKALNLLMGGRSADSVVRTGCSHAMVEGLFDLSEFPSIASEIAEMTGLQEVLTDGQVVLSRRLTPQNKSLFRINGSMATAGMVKDIGIRLIDIHSQHHSQKLLQKECHHALLDSFGGPEHQGLLDRYAAILSELRSLRKKLADLEDSYGDRGLTLDLLRYQADEIDGASLQDLDEASLESRRRSLASHSDIQALAGETTEAMESLNGGDGILGSIDRLIARTRRMVGISPVFVEVMELFENARINLDEGSRTLDRFADSITFDEEEAARIDEVLSGLEGLKRKYGPGIRDILAYREKIREQISTLENYEDICADIRAKLSVLREEITLAADGLTDSRRQIARSLEKSLARELKDLGIPNPRISIRVESRFSGRDDAVGVSAVGVSAVGVSAVGVSAVGVSAVGAPAVGDDPVVDDQVVGPGVGESDGFFRRNGADTVDFMVAFNSGEPLQPMESVASGGEISRLMLCMKKVFAAFEPRPVMVFDEIDTGIGGKTAGKVGAKIAQISVDRQVIAITHLAQIAAMGENHFEVVKAEETGRTITLVRRIEGQDRLNALAEMMGSDGETAMAHARELLARSGASEPL